MPNHTNLLRMLTAVAVLALGPWTHGAVKTWNNTGTDFNDGGSWTGGLPGTADIATFSGAPGTQPNVTANISVSGLDFSTAATSGYSLTSSGGAVLELLSTASGLGSAAISHRATSGTNTISADLNLGAAGNQFIVQAAASTATLILSGEITGTGGLSVTTTNTNNAVRLTNANNSFAGGVTVGGNSGGRIETTAFGMADGSNSPLGTATTINLGTTGAGVIRYIGAGETTDKIINLSGTTIGAQIQTTGATGALTLTADLMFTGSVNKTLTLQGGTAGSIVHEFAGDISDGTGGGTVGLSLVAAVWTLSGNNSYSAGTSINTGTHLNLNSATALGTGGITIPGTGVTFSLDNTSGAPVVMTANNIWTVSGFTFTGSNDLNLGAGTLTINSGSRTITVNGSTLTVGGTVAQTGGTMNLTKAGVGTLVLAGDNTYTGTTAVNAGTLLINGGATLGTNTSNITVNTGGTLGGSGVIRGTVLVNSGGNLAPGNSPGILTVGGLTLSLGANFIVELLGPTAGSQYDQVVVTAGTVTLGSANLVLNITGPLNVFTYGDVLTLINNTGSGSISGTFLGLSDGDYVYVSGNRFATIHYGLGAGGDVWLTVVPEPTSGGVALLLGMGWTTIRRRRCA